MCCLPLGVKDINSCQGLGLLVLMASSLST